MSESEQPISSTSLPPQSSSAASEANPSTSEDAAAGGQRKKLLEGKDVTAGTTARSRTLVTGTPTFKEGPSKRKVIQTADEATPSSWLPALTAAVVACVVLGSVGLWFYKSRIEPRLGGTVGAAPASSTNGTSREAEALKAELSGANGKITELQKQIDAQRAEREFTQKQIQEMTDRMALVIKQNTFVPSAETTHVGAGEASQMAALLPTVTPSISELILLKERNRLMGYADETIATGQREPLMSLVRSMMDPALKNLHFAAAAEYKRVQTHFEFSLSIDPSYSLPIREMFKNPDIRSEADLSPEQLSVIAQDLKLPWEARLRSIYLLRSSKSPETDKLLLKIMKEDPSLDVAKQAQTTFENRNGRRFRIFDIPAIEAWVQAQGGNGGDPKSSKEPAVKMVEPSSEPPASTPATPPPAPAVEAPPAAAKPAVEAKPAAPAAAKPKP